MSDLTPKQEKFAQLYVETGNASEAYRVAYNSSAKHESVNVNASKLLSSAKVALRVKELQNELRAAHRATMDDILAELEEARQLARDLQQPSAMNQSSLGKAKILGFDKQVVDHISSDSSMSPGVAADAVLAALKAKHDPSTNRG
ncbi:terminase small subunit [Idiomarinaceae phage 1N2-2]|uniref:terminase small subunit n=1 Tax=Idiomarinaceae phage 1N2-2 TaxID=1536592 RepID=UPI0004F6136D|nr:terminase small subunit [Idiomarinaceae phage 1N2-2]AIM40703.1 putative small terminase [Idiomarinaceae phage 1N2-2]